MPTYDYHCNACGHELEIFQSMKDAPKRKCPKCGKNALERKIGTGGAIIFKGSGFYQTDYRSESYKKAAESEKKPADGAKTEAAGKSESKPETKSETKTEPAKKADKPAKEPATKKPKKPAAD